VALVRVPFYFVNLWLTVTDGRNTYGEREHIRNV